MDQLPKGIAEFTALQDTLFTGLSVGTLIWGTFYLIVGIFIIHGLLLLYHWLRYGSLYALTWIAMIAHAGVSITLIGIMLGSALTLT